MSFRVAASHILHRRSVDEKWNLDPYKINRIKEQTRLRWVTFSLGTLPQYIKLFGSKGIPISTAFGALYLASWLIFELLFWAAEIDHYAVQPVLAVPASSHNRWRRRLWALLALFANALVYTAPSPFFLTGPWPRFSVNIVPDLAFGLFRYGIMGLWFCLLPDIRLRHHLTRSTVFLVSFPLCLLALLPMLISLWLGGQGMSLNHEDVLTNIILMSISDWAMGVAFVALMFDNGLWGMKGCDIMRLSTFTHLPLLYYCTLYEPAGTHQPPWMRWLG
ncbi:hypothetical protein BJY01DRAFT_247347 [Aspergillus pseudoustus]|uniref:Uncharacterized protein n=1 Tax=Aspergillus pseudoustus TaxID=1810923 RepID=A0ABR4K1G4_9EURO